MAKGMSPDYGNPDPHWRGMLVYALLGGLVAFLFLWLF